MKKKNLSQKELVVNLYDVVKDKFVLEFNDITKLEIAVKKDLELRSLYVSKTSGGLYMTLFFRTVGGDVTITANSQGLELKVPGDNISDFDITGVLKKSITVVKKLPDVKAIIKKELKTRDRMFVVGNKLYKVLEVLEGATNE